MEKRYPILLGGQSVGEALVCRQGLYVCFRCRCRLSGETVYRLTVVCGGCTENLGIPVPAGEWFCLDTRIPAKRLGEGEPVIRAVPKRAEMYGEFVPLSPEEPFAYLNRLKNAFLEERGGRLGVVLRDAEEAEPKSV